METDLHHTGLIPSALPLLCEVQLHLIAPSLSVWTSFLHEWCWRQLSSQTRTSLHPFLCFFGRHRLLDSFWSSSWLGEARTHTKSWISHQSCTVAKLADSSKKHCFGLCDLCWIFFIGVWTPGRTFFFLFVNVENQYPSNSSRASSDAVGWTPGELLCVFLITLEVCDHIHSVILCFLAQLHKVDAFTPTAAPAPARWNRFVVSVQIGATVWSCSLSSPSGVLTVLGVPNLVPIRLQFV